jgi:hypothetical protein
MSENHLGTCFRNWPICIKLSVHEKANIYEELRHDVSYGTYELWGKINLVPRAFPFLSLGSREKALGRSHDFQHPDIVGVINYNNNELENPRWPPT